MQIKLSFRYKLTDRHGNVNVIRRGSVDRTAQVVRHTCREIVRRHYVTVLPIAELHSFPCWSFLNYTAGLSVPVIENSLLEIIQIMFFFRFHQQLCKYVTNNQGWYSARVGVPERLVFRGALLPLWASVVTFLLVVLHQLKNIQLHHFVFEPTDKPANGQLLKRKQVTSVTVVSAKHSAPCYIYLAETDRTF